MSAENFITIGKITKPVGLKGYIKALSLTDFPERFESLSYVKLFNEKENLIIKNKFSDSDVFIIKDVIFEKDFIKILFEDFNNVDSIRNLIGCLLIIEESERKTLGKDKYYYYDLIGLDVILNEKIIGKTIAIENYGGQDLFKIELTESKKEILIPYVNEFIRNINLKNKCMEIEVIDGMLN